MHNWIILLTLVTASYGEIVHNVSWNLHPALFNQAFFNNFSLFQNIERPEIEKFLVANDSEYKVYPNINIFSDSSFMKNAETCSLCFIREQVREHNVASLKLHILRRLEMEQPPNITIRPHISEKVIRSFYEKHGYRYIRLNDTTKRNMFGQRDSRPSSLQYNTDIHKELDSQTSFTNLDYYDEYDYYTNNYDNFQYSNEYFGAKEIDETEDDIFSKINRVYYFPKYVAELEQGDILQFVLQKNDFQIQTAFFNLYVNGEKWIAEHFNASSKLNATSMAENRTLGDDINDILFKHISITVNTVRFNKSTSDLSNIRTYSNYVGEIPKGVGQWIRFNITKMFGDWLQTVEQPGEHFSFDIFLKAMHPWTRRLIALDITTSMSPFIETYVAREGEQRSKRHISLNCNENDKNVRCCRYPLRVDFRKFGWNWIIAPDIYEAYYCSGECSTGFLPKHPHSYIYQLSTSFNPCCSPRKLSPLNLLYFDDNQQVIHSIIPNMAVEKCSCS